MRRSALVLILLIAFGTVSASAEEVRRPDRGDRFTISRFVRTVKSILKPQTNSDGLTPPVPAPAPGPRP